MTRTDAGTRTRRNISLLNHLGHGNLGDDATFDAVMENIKSRWPDAEIIGFSLNPFDTRKRHGIPSYAIRRDSKLPPQAAEPAPRKAGMKAGIKSLLKRSKLLLAILKTGNSIIIGLPKAIFQEASFLAESFHIMKSQDLLVMCGGGQLLDSWGGPWSFPYTLFKWTILAKLSGAECYFINVGAGPLRQPLSKWFIKHALGMADYVSFRDEASRKLVQDLGFKRETQSFPDSAYSLTVPAIPEARNRERVVGLSPMPFCDPRVYWTKDQGLYDSYIRNLADFGSWLIRDQNRLVLFSTDIWFDRQAIEDVMAGLRIDAPGSGSVTHVPITGTGAMFSEMSAMDCVVTSRFHGVIFAHLMNKPVLAISTHPKVSTLMAELGLSEYCVDARSCEPEVLREKFLRLTANHDAIKAQMAERVASYRSGLQAQFDVLFQAQDGAARRTSQSSGPQRARVAV